MLFKVPLFQIFSNAANDLVAAIRMRRVWVALASEDIGDQHKRTTLGPLWLLINYLAFAGTFIFIFGNGDRPHEYPTYVATGLLVWFYLMEVITGSVTLFSREESFIKGTTLPLSVYVMRAALQTALRAGYSLIGCTIILLASGTLPAAPWLWSLLGVLLILFIAPAVILSFAFLGVFFPDSQYIVSNLIRVGMFVTPVFWIPNANTRGIRAAFYHYNPFTYFLDIVRQPIVYGIVPVEAFWICLVFGAGAWILGMILLGRFRRQVALVL
jgi:lipopolysaccharide transport system permease protein